MKPQALTIFGESAAVYQSFEIKNFRCFRYLKMESLKRVNLIAGSNNAGKTSLLEALFLFAGPTNPGLSLRVSAFRGIDQFKPEAEDLWGWLFLDRDMEGEICLRGISLEGVCESLEIRLVTDVGTRLPDLNNGEGISAPTPTTSTESSNRALVLRYERGSEDVLETRAYLTPNNELRTEPELKLSRPISVYLGTRLSFQEEDAQRFSDLQKTGKDRELLEALCLLEPRLKSLSLQFSAKRLLVHGDIGLGELIPFPLMGEGCGRLLRILSAVASAPGGMVFIDEVENGFHHSTLPDVWRAISHAARKADVQVFATTHSRECIVAAHHAFRDVEEYEFGLHRLERDDKNIKSVGYDEEALEGAVAFDMEVR